MNNRMKNFYLSIADDCATMSRAVRLKVGCVIVKDDNIISYSWNGTPAGWDNNCENKEFWNPEFEDLHFDELEDQYPFIETSDEDGAYLGRYRLKTKPEVLHAEMNSLMKLAKTVNSGYQSSMFITHSPCLECAKGIYQAGIKEVFYKDDYRSEDGINFLKKCGIKVEKLSKENKEDDR